MLKKIQILKVKPMLTFPGLLKSPSIVMETKCNGTQGQYLQQQDGQIHA